MPPTKSIDKRRCIARGLTALCGAALLPVAIALDFTMPKIEDLRPKWGSLGIGTSETLAIQLMGSPNARTEKQTLGVPRLSLHWKDIKGFRYTAHFVGGRLYDKEASDRD
jgi:hypothetical protein